MFVAPHGSPHPPIPPPHPNPPNPHPPPPSPLQYYKWTAPAAGFATVYACSNKFLASLTVLGNGTDADGNPVVVRGWIGVEGALACLLGEQVDGALACVSGLGFTKSV